MLRRHSLSGGGNFLKLGVGIEVAPVLAQLAEHPELWDQIRCRTIEPISPHHESSDIWIRYGDLKPALESGDWAVMREPHEALWYPAWYVLTALHPIIDDIAQRVEATRIGGIWITRLKPGAGIRMHRDFGWHCDTFDKYYVALQADPGAVFGCDGEEIETEPGSCILMDNHRLHWVRNASQRDRLMLIACMQTTVFDAFHGRI